MKERTLNKYKAPENHNDFTWCESSIRVNGSGFLLIKNYGNYQQLIYPIVKKISFDEMSVHLKRNNIQDMIGKIEKMAELDFRYLFLKLDDDLNLW